MTRFLLSALVVVVCLAWLAAMQSYRAANGREPFSNCVRTFFATLALLALLTPGLLGGRFFLPAAVVAWTLGVTHGRTLSAGQKAQTKEPR